MAITFENTPLRWDNVGVEPSESLKTNGFQAGYRPPASVFNHQINNTSACITEIQEKVASHAHAMSDLTGTLPVSKGGTGQTKLTSGHILLGGGTNGIGSTATLPLSKGGTGATSAANARNNLGVEGTVLYSNDSGTSGTITLSETALNYQYLRIRYQNYMYVDETTTILPFGNRTLTSVHYDTSSGPSATHEIRANITVSENTINFGIFYTFIIDTAGNVAFTYEQNQDKIRIIEVKGYKY